MLALIAPTLRSQQRDTTADTVISRRRSPLDTVVVTGSLGLLHNIGVARSVLGYRQLIAEPAREAVDVLRNMAGVHIDEANGPLGPAIIRLRGGEETFTRVLMDGVALNENGGFFDAQGVTLVNVDRVEIARGPQSVVYGSSAMSGVVQMFTRPGRPGPARVDASVEAGRNAWYGRSVRGSALVQGGSDAARYSAGFGSLYDRGIYRLPNDVRSNDASLRVDLLPRPSLVVTTVARFLGVDGKLPVRDPGVTRAPLDPNQRQGRDRMLGTVQATVSAGEHWTHRLQLSHYRRDFTYDDAFDNIDQTRFSSYVFDANYHYKSIVRRSNARYVGTAVAHPGGTDLSLSFGGEYERESLSDNQTGDFGPASQIVARPSVAGFGEAQAALGDRVSVLVGSRIEKFRGLAAAHVPRATLVLGLIPGHVSLRGGVSRAYKAPNIQEQFPNNPAIVANPDLKPETSRSWEIGADVTAWRGLANLAVTYFDQDYQNLIRTVNFDSTRQIARNLGRSRTAGLETELTVRPAPLWTLGAEAAWLGTRIVDNGGLFGDDFPNGGTLPFRPAYTASIYVDAPATNAVSVIVRATAVGSQTVLANRFSGPRAGVDSYRVLGATAHWRLAGATSAYLQVENLLNTYYDVGYDRPGRERALIVGLRSVAEFP